MCARAASGASLLPPSCLKSTTRGRALTLPDRSASSSSGGFGTTCGADSDCLGFLYCTDPTGETVIGSCGADGAFCVDPSAPVDPDASAADQAPVYNQYCASGFCSVNNGGVCSEFVTQVGGDCSFDPEFVRPLARLALLLSPRAQSADALLSLSQACTVDTVTGAALTCDATLLTCQLAPVPTGARARARRAGANGAALFKRRACPLSHTACSISGAKGFECVDTQSNLEQCAFSLSLSLALGLPAPTTVFSLSSACADLAFSPPLAGGACSTEGGVDCTSLPGVESVGCMAGVCESLSLPLPLGLRRPELTLSFSTGEIWSCADGYSFDAASSECVATLA